MSKGCPHFLAYTFMHWVGAIGLTALGTQYDILPRTSVVSLISFVVLLIIAFILPSLSPGVPKYLVYATFLLLLSQSLRTLEERLQEKGLLTEVCVMTLGIFIPMVLLGFYDGASMLPWTTYLYVSLIGLIVARIILYILAITDTIDTKELTTGSKILSTFAVGLFALFTTHDINLIRLLAKTCKSNPDYINASLGIFLDLLNLFTSSADILSD